VRLCDLIYQMLYYQPGEPRDEGKHEIRAIGPERCVNSRIHNLWAESDAHVSQYPVWTYTAFARKLSRALSNLQEAM